MIFLGCGKILAPREGLGHKGHSENRYTNSIKKHTKTQRGTMERKFMVWCDVCGYRGAFKTQERAEIIGLLHKQGSHGWKWYKNKIENKENCIRPKVKKSINKIIKNNRNLIIKLGKDNG